MSDFQIRLKVHFLFPKTLEAARSGVGRRRDVAPEKDMSRVSSSTDLLENVSFAATPDEKPDNRSIGSE